MDLINFERRARPGMGQDRDNSGNESGGGGFVPLALRDPVVVLSAHEVSTSAGTPTVFIGILQERFTDEMWEDCVRRMKQQFNIRGDNEYVEIKALPLKEKPGELDTTTMNAGISNALKFLNDNTDNNNTTEFIRIINIGVSSSTGIFEALETLIQAWKQDVRKKNVQLVTVGETRNRDRLNFCKWLCLKGRVNSLQFYNVKDYTQFGLLDLVKRCKELVSGHH